MLTRILVLVINPALFLATARAALGNPLICTPTNVYDSAFPPIICTETNVYVVQTLFPCCSVDEIPTPSGYSNLDTQGIGAQPVT
jgi:hypothetical protein